LATRLLYSDKEESFLTARRPCVFNGIDALTTRGDLLDRTLTVDLPRIGKQDRKEEGAIMKDFNRILPQLLGLILDATVTGLRRESCVVEDNLPRMADFYKWVVACEPSLPWQQGEFIAAFKRQSKESMGSLIASDRFASAVYQHALKLIPGREFKCTASDLLLQLKNTDAYHEMAGNWPANGSALGKYLRRVAPALRPRGLQ
jgi:putative DNA primase/helicase